MPTKPEASPTAVAKPGIKQQVDARKVDPKSFALENLKHKERQALAKKKRITESWPKEHQENALERVDANLSHIREEMKKLA